MALIAYAERAFLQLLARRLLRYSREAEARGEKYYDIYTRSPLQCGLQAKMVFEHVPGGYAPVLYVHNSVALPNETLLEAAEYVLEGPVKCRKTDGADLEYTLANSIPIT